MENQAIKLILSMALASHVNAPDPYLLITRIHLRQTLLNKHVCLNDQIYVSSLNPSDVKPFLCIPIGFELPRINYDINGKKHRFVYGCCAEKSAVATEVTLKHDFLFFFNNAKPLLMHNCLTRVPTATPTSMCPTSGDLNMSDSCWRQRLENSNKVVSNRKQIVPAHAIFTQLGSHWQNWELTCDLTEAGKYSLKQDLRICRNKQQHLQSPTAQTFRVPMVENVRSNDQTIIQCHRGRH